MSLHFAVYKAERGGPREEMRPDLRLSNNSQGLLSIINLNRGLRCSKPDLVGAASTGDEGKHTELGLASGDLSTSQAKVVTSKCHLISSRFPSAGTYSAEGLQIILSMCLKFPIPIVEHLITGWWKEKGSENKAMSNILAVGFMLIYHLSYNSNLLRWYLASPTGHI